MKFCPQCNEDFPALEQACPRCGGLGRDPQFLRGIPEPDDPPETLGDWMVVLRTPDEVQARLAQGFLATQDIESIVFPLEGATGLEVFGRLPVADFADQGRLTGTLSRHRHLPIKLMVDPEDAPEALRLLRGLRERPVTLSENEDVGE